MLKMYLNTKYFLQMYSNNNYINVFKYFCIFYIIFKISSLFICSIINLKMNEILDIELVQLYNMSIIYSRYPVAQIGDWIATSQLLNSRRYERLQSPV